MRHVATVDYKQFTITAFEHSAGKWRARVWRIRPKPFRPHKVSRFETQKDSASAAEALKAAMEAVDAGAFSRTLGAERYHGVKRGRLSGR